MENIIYGKYLVCNNSQLEHVVNMLPDKENLHYYHAREYIEKLKEAIHTHRQLSAKHDISSLIKILIKIYSYLKHTTRRIPAGIVAATFLFIDSWHDVITSQKGSDRIAAIVMALFLQIPLGVFLIRRSNHLWREILAH